RLLALLILAGLDELAVQGRGFGLAVAGALVPDLGFLDGLARQQHRVAAAAVVPCVGELVPADVVVVRLAGASTITARNLCAGGSSSATKGSPTWRTAEGSTASRSATEGRTTWGTAERRTTTRGTAECRTTTRGTAECS